MKIKQIFALLIVVGIVSIAAAFAFAYQGDSGENANKQRGNGLDEIAKEEMVERKIEIINKRVEEGVITREEADTLINEFKSCLECDGNCEPREEGLGKKYNLKFGFGNNDSQGNGQGYGKGQGEGQGNGNGICAE